MQASKKRAQGSHNKILMSGTIGACLSSVPHVAISTLVPFQTMFFPQPTVRTPIVVHPHPPGAAYWDLLAAVLLGDVHKICTPVSYLSPRNEYVP